MSTITIRLFLPSTIYVNHSVILTIHSLSNKSVEHNQVQGTIVSQQESTSLLGPSLQITIWSKSIIGSSIVEVQKVWKVIGLKKVEVQKVQKVQKI